MFRVYFKLGLQHILDLQAADHMAFILVLIATFSIRNLKKVAILATAFTLGHSITLAVAALDLIKVNGDLIEFLIPLTIIISALYNITISNKQNNFLLHYMMAGVFGLIHGMGFSSYFRSLMSKSESIIEPLLYFNLGVEIGQLVFISIFLFITAGLLRYTKVTQNQLNYLLSGIGIGIALQVITGG